MSNYDFKGFYRRNLPHWQPAGGTLFITCCLAGALPQSTLDWYERERRNLAAQAARLHASERGQRELELQQRWFGRIESALHKSESGPLWLKGQQIATLASNALHFHDGKMYRLDAYCIMPNHVHFVVVPLEEAEPTKEVRQPKYYSLSRITHSFKGYTAGECNRILNRKGEFWLHESYDRAIRNHEEWQRVITYVINNPVKAGLVTIWQDWPYTYLRDQT